MRQIEKIVMLQTLDALWKDHLLAMDHLKEGIGLRGYGQLNPLVEYQKEGFDDVRGDDAGDAAGRSRESLLGAGAARAGRAADGAAAAASAEGRDESWQPRPSSSATRRPVKRDSRQGRAQRSMSVRLGQEIQTLPRQVSRDIRLYFPIPLSATDFCSIVLAPES